jgi:formamidopyrimidine-DNA glycosylase
MDQTFIAGIGNVYGDEILYQAKIHPERRANELNSSQICDLYMKIKSVLSNACKLYDLIHIDKNWFLSGRRLGFCPRCNVTLGRVKIQGRYSYFCPRCQTFG